MASCFGPSQHLLHRSLCFLWCAISHWTASAETDSEAFDCMSSLQLQSELNIPLQQHQMSSSPYNASPTEELSSISEREYHLLPHHKTGTGMCRRALEFMRELGNTSVALVQENSNTMGLTLDSSALQLPRPSCFAHIMRNPFEIVVSGHGYHMAAIDKVFEEDYLSKSFGQAIEEDSRGCEHSFRDGRVQQTCKDRDEYYWSFRMLQGVAHVFRSQNSGPLSASLVGASLNETLADYYGRVDLNTSLIAEFTLASNISLAPMSFAHNFMESQPCSISLCLNDFYEDCNAAWGRVMETWEIQEPERSAALRLATRSCPGVDPIAQEHSTKHIMRSENIKHTPEHKLVKLLRELDRLFLNGTLAALEENLGCPVSGKYAEPAQAGAL